MRAIVVLLLLACMSVAVSAIQTQTRVRAAPAAQDMELVDESALVEAAATPVIIETPAADAPVFVSEVTETPVKRRRERPTAIVGKVVPANLKKPIIFTNTTETPVDPDAPIIGKAPANLKKPANITENIYGGAVEFKVRRNLFGCPCLKQMPEKHRYDIEYKPEKQPRQICPCLAKMLNLNETRIAQLKHERFLKKHNLPPVVADLYPEKQPRWNQTHRVLRRAIKKLLKLNKPPKEMVAPEYIADMPDVGAANNITAILAAAGVFNGTGVLNVTAVAQADGTTLLVAQALPNVGAANNGEMVAPAFYPPRPDRETMKAKRKAFKAKKAARVAKKEARKARKEVRKARQEAKNAKSEAEKQAAIQKAKEAKKAAKIAAEKAKKAAKKAARKARQAEKKAAEAAKKA